MKRKSQGTGLLSGLFLPLVLAAAAVFFAAALNSLDQGRAQETYRRLEETLRRGCVACYAAEGIYPPDIAYLQDHYGVQIDTGRYTVHYSVFAENRMPDITVLENNP